jgi:hypothetical protein
VKSKLRENEFDRDFVITTEKMFQDGNDRRDFEILMNAIPMRSAGAVEQIIGRLRTDEDNPKKKNIYVDIIDKGYKSLVGTAGSRTKVLERFSKKILVLDVSDKIYK